MADPTKFTPDYSYSGYQANSPTKPLPAQRIDDDFAKAQRSINETIDALADIRRSDGKLRNNSVGPDQLSPALNIGFTNRGLWKIGTRYNAGDGVVHDDRFYTARKQHKATDENRPNADADCSCVDIWRYLFSAFDITVPDGSVTTEKLADEATSTEKLADFSVTHEKLAGKAVTYEKLDASALDPYPTVIGMSGVKVPKGVSTIQVGGYYAAGDGGAALYKKVAIEPSHAGKFQTLDGAWWELAVPAIRAEMIAPIGSGAENAITVGAAIQCAQLFGVPFEVGSVIEVDGSVNTKTGVVFDFKGAGELRQTGISRVGAFVTTVTLDPLDRVQSDITLLNPRISGEFYPDPIILTISEGSTTTSITFDQNASNVDGFYNRRIFQVLDGVLANGLGSRTIVSYVGSTRTATFTTALASAPVAGTHVQLGFNDNAFGGAWGVKRIKINGGRLYGYPTSKMTPPVAGGKGAGFEQGADDITVTNVTVDSCTTAMFASGTSGYMTNGERRKVIGTRFSNIHAEMCDSLITAANLDLTSGIPNTNDDLQVIFENITYHNCGHAPWRIVGGSQEKSGVINLMGANGATIGNVRGFNDDDYISKAGGYPTDFPARVGYGLAGPIGAVVWGHARNTSLYEIHHGGDVDAAVHVGRVRALGDDAPGGSVSEMIGWEIDGLHVYGHVGRIVSRDENIGNVGTEIHGYWRVIVDGISDVFLPPQFSNATGLILDITRRQDGTRVIGNPHDIIIRGNNFDHYIAGATTDLRIVDKRRITFEDDEVVKFVPVKKNGTLRLNNAEQQGSATANNFLITYSIYGSSLCIKNYGDRVNVWTEPLIAGTNGGTDGNWNVSAVVNDGIYIKNRNGGATTVDIFLQ